MLRKSAKNVTPPKGQADPFDFLPVQFRFAAWKQRRLRRGIAALSVLSLALIGVYATAVYSTQETLRFAEAADTQANNINNANTGKMELIELEQQLQTLQEMLPPLEGTSKESLAETSRDVVEQLAFASPNTVITKFDIQEGANACGAVAPAAANEIQACVTLGLQNTQVGNLTRLSNTLLNQIQNATVVAIVEASESTATLIIGVSVPPAQTDNSEV